MARGARNKSTRTKGAPDLLDLVRRPSQAADLVVALRASLRALPAVFYDKEGLFEPPSEALIVASWRSASAVWLASRSGGEFSALGYIARTLALAGERLSNPPATQANDSLFSTLEAAIDVGRSKVHAAAAIEEASGACNAASPHNGAGRAAQEATQNDVRLLDEGMPPEALVVRPLWHESQPHWHALLWHRAKESLLKLEQSWDVWFDWYDARLRGEPGVNEQEFARVREVTEDDWKLGALTANNKIRKLLESYATPNIADVLALAANEQDAPPISVASSQLRFGEFKVQDDAVAALQPGIQAEYGAIRQQLRSLSKQVDAWVNEDCHPDWHGLKTDVSRLGRLLKPDMEKAVEQISVVWAAGVAVAEYLDQDRQLRTSPTSGNAPSLPLPLRNKLTTFIQVFGAWLLEFPTVRQREENAHSFTAAIERVHNAKQVVHHVRASNALRTSDLELLEELLRVSTGTGTIATKARFWSLSTVKKLLLTGGKMVAMAAAGNVLEDVAKSSELLARLKKLLLEGEASILTFASDLPASTREAFIALVERIRDSSGGHS